MLRKNNLLPSQTYNRFVEKGLIRRDPEQLKIMEELDVLFSSLQLFEKKRQSIIDPSMFSLHNIPIATATKEMLNSWIRFFRLRNVPKGLYIHGGVGVGKSLLMDLFYQCCVSSDLGQNIGTKRIHFHEFMLDVHKRMHQLRKAGESELNPLQVVAGQIAKESKILCFDEFQVTDIGDAVILKNLFSFLFDFGVVVVSTSNRAPHQLYEGGLNRSLFLPFIDFLQERCIVMHIPSKNDYRVEKLENDCINSFFHPLSRETTKTLWGIFYQLTSGKHPRETLLEVGFGRKQLIKNACAPTVAFFDFRDLCLKPLSSVDYLSIASSFESVIIDNIPIFDENHHNEARRFINLVDALYENGTVLYCGSQAQLDDIFCHEERNWRVEEDDAALQVWIDGKGGSSGRSTTMIGEMEWSATGRAGAALAEFSASQDVAFAFSRAKSRLKEMQGVEYHTQRNVRSLQLYK